uniref:Uncharacterized protein n=1 Tax=Parascaris univalens TaxID=6257 RepID=A0A915C6W3_PARUN
SFSRPVGLSLQSVLPPSSHELLVVLLIDEVTSPVLLQCNALKTRNTLLRHRWCIVRRCSKLRKVKKPRRALLISKINIDRDPSLRSGR